MVEQSRRRGNPDDPIRALPGSSGHGTVLEAMLNEALATELVCALRYRGYSLITQHPVVDRVKRKFLRYAQVQQEQADRIAERIVKLGGAPHVDTSDLAARSQSRRAAGTPLQVLLGEDLLFERMTIETYDGMVRYFDARDPMTAGLLASVLAIHVEHAEELAELLIGPSPPLRTSAPLRT
jgi:bacterioferritin